MKRISLNDITFLIPVRIDTLIRLENLLLSIRYLQQYFCTNIIVLEASSYNNHILHKHLNNKINYLFIEDKDPVFYRTKYLNLMTPKATTPYIAIWDADVIVPKGQIIDSIMKLRGGFDVVYPYSGIFYDTSDIIRELYIRTKKIELLIKEKNKMNLPYGKKMVGGAIFVNKESYIRSGMENMKFYGWGPEDGERYNRWKVLGYKIYFSFGPLFHLSHPRGNNSSYRSNNYKIKTQKELFLVQQSSKEDFILASDKSY